jgi:predicted RNA-binding Zn-ribbon protein involved in translation (DUF1610 family)
MSKIKDTERRPVGDGMISAAARKVLMGEQSIDFDCPSCGKKISVSLPSNIVSCTVRCTYCDCSIGLSDRGLKSKSIVVKKLWPGEPILQALFITEKGSEIQLETMLPPEMFEEILAKVTKYMRSKAYARIHPAAKNVEQGLESIGTFIVQRSRRKSGPASSWLFERMEICPNEAKTKEKLFWGSCAPR